MRQKQRKAVCRKTNSGSHVLVVSNDDNLIHQIIESIKDILSGSSGSQVDANTLREEVAAVRKAHAQFGSDKIIFFDQRWSEDDIRTFVETGKKPF